MNINCHSNFVGSQRVKGIDTSQPFYLKHETFFNFVLVEFAMSKFDFQK